MDPVLADAVDRLLSRSKALGADQADAACSTRQSLSASVRLGRLEGVEREEARSAGLRVVIGKRQAGASTSDLSPAALDMLAERVVAMARAAAEDPWCGLPEAHETARDLPDLDTFDDTEPSIDRLEARALACEGAAMDVAGVTNSSGAGADWGASGIVYGASNGFRGGWRGTSWHVGVSVLAERGDEKERDWEGDGARREAGLRDPAEVGRIAGERTVRRLGATKIESRVAPVIFENRMASRLMSMLAGAISGAAVARGISFLRDGLGAEVFGAHVTIVDDPLKRGGWSSHPFDGEGSPVARRSIVENGVLTTWLMNRSSAAQLGLATTGHATMNPGGPPGVGPSNFTLMPGPRDLAGLMADAGTGLLVTETMSPSFNPNTGDYSVGVSGFWFETGRIVRPVNEITVAGAMRDIYRRMIPGSDLEGRSSIDSPSVLVDAMTIAGL